MSSAFANTTELIGAHIPLASLEKGGLSTVLKTNNRVNEGRIQIGPYEDNSLDNVHGRLEGDAKVLKVKVAGAFRSDGIPRDQRVSTKTISYRSTTQTRRPSASLLILSFQSSFVPPIAAYENSHTLLSSFFMHTILC